MDFFEKLRLSLSKFFGTTEQEKQTEDQSPLKVADVENKESDRYRARDSKGRYLGDDPDTPEDEAWVIDGDKNT